MTTRPAPSRPDTIIAAAAEHARCDAIATIDERMASATIPVRLP